MSRTPRVKRRGNFEHFFAVGSQHIAPRDQPVKRFGVQFHIIRLALISFREFLL